MKLSRSVQPKDKQAKMLDRLQASPSGEWTYAHSLAVEESLRTSAWGLPVRTVAPWIKDGKWTGPFNSLNFRLFVRTGDQVWLDAFEESATAILSDPMRSPEAAWMHPCGLHLPGAHAILLDSFQESASRLIKLAWLIRRGEPVKQILDPDDLEETACQQFELHREILRDPETGLWHNGRGWIAGDASLLSPGAWSRGHGWLMRGLMECLDHLENSPRRERLIRIFSELADALLLRQTNSGLWHALLNEPPESSPLESSGSALITSALIRAGQSGLPGISTGTVPVMESAKVLMDEYLTEEGIVLGTCKGPGPLVSDAAYHYPARFEDPDAHGPAAFCALAAAIAMQTSVPSEATTPFRD